MTLDEAVRLTGGITPSILKMDIEGWEFDVLPFWDRKYKHLPEQLVFELHYAHLYFGTSNYKNTSAEGNMVWPGIQEVSLGQLSLLFLHLANLGYGIVNLERGCGHCGEFTLLRVESPEMRMDKL